MSTTADHHHTDLRLVTKRIVRPGFACLSAHATAVDDESITE